MGAERVGLVCGARFPRGELYHQRWPFRKLSKQWPDSVCIETRLSFVLPMIRVHGLANKIIRWSYNQGVILGGLVELNRAAPNDTYLESANKIAQAAINTLSDANMVIHDVCEPNCAPDATQFKGIFIRNLQMLQQVSPNDIYKKVIQACANSIWTNDRNNQNQLGVNWAGPFASADASTHSSALDALVAAIAI